MDGYNIDSRFAKEPDWVTREVAGETIVVPIRGHVADVDAIYTLNESGTEIWKLIDGQVRVKQIVEDICTAYEIDSEKATTDAIDFLNSLETAGLIKKGMDPCD